MVINPQKAIDEGWITFPEEPLNREQLQPNGIDLRLKVAWKIPIHKPFKIYNDKTVHLDRYRAEGSIHNDHPSILFQRCMAYNVETFEFIDIPENVTALIFGRSSLNRNGILCRASVYDSGFTNFAGFTIYPFVPFEAHFGVRLAQIVFMESDSCHLYEGQYQLLDYGTSDETKN
jgi:deoxycytidine triphosphate deaminase